MKYILSVTVVTLIMQMMLTLFLLGFHAESVNSAFQLGIDSVPVVVVKPAVEPVDPIHWWYGTGNLKEARDRLCSH